MADTHSPQFRKARAVAKEIGLTTPERMELAEYLLRRDVDSWKRDVDDDQLVRLLDAMEGYQLISQLIALRTEQGHDAVVSELDDGQDSGSHMVFGGVGGSSPMFGPLE